jgi:non-ribosomal peptide synthase protein (TIGR01720 family)
LSPNGKVDRQALPAPDLTRPELEAAHEAPQNEVEQTIADIWQDLLGIKQIGVHDNFFDLGGDSILGLQIIARANKARLQLTPQQIFEYQTIAELAAVAGTASVIKAEQGLVTGSAPLTPIQHWFFEQKFPDPHHWNQSILLEVQQIIAPAVLDRIVQQLILHHDSLRLRFIQKESGWQQIVASSDETVSVLRMDLSALSESEQGPAMESAAADFQAGLNLSEGPIMQVALFDLGPHKPSRLLLVIHHLAIDAVSWRILLADLEVSYQQLSQGEAIQLPPKTTSFKYWTQCLADYRLSAALQAELDYWLAEPWAQVGPLPVDFPEQKEGNIEVSTRTISVSLDIEETRVLLQEVPKAYNTQINDVLLTALVQTFKEWTGQRYLLVDLEGHGREAIFEDVDLSRTVGWFTTIFPVLLNLGKVSEPGEVLKSIKEQLRRIPNNGIGYGLLRYLSKDTEIVKKLQAIPQAELSFNYLGQFDQTLSPTSPFKLTNESCGPIHSLRGTRSHLLAINGRIIKSQLQLDWIYSENLHRHATIEGLAESYITALRVLIAHCQSSKTTGYTPSDFPEVNLSQQELDDLIAELGEATE